MEKINFREFLRDRGLLGEYARILTGAGMRRNLITDPHNELAALTWISAAFTLGGLQCTSEWSKADDDWCRIVFDNKLIANPDNVEFGFPLEDELGMALLLAEPGEPDG